MPRIDTYASLGLASVILLAGCGRPETPTTASRRQSRGAAGAVRRLEPRLLSAGMVVAASHEAALASAPRTDSNDNNHQVADPVQPARLWPPFVTRTNYPNTAQQENRYPSTSQAGPAYRPEDSPRAMAVDAVDSAPVYPSTADYRAKSATLERLPKERLPRERLPRERLPRERLPSLPKERLPRERLPQEHLPAATPVRNASTPVAIDLTRALPPTPVSLAPSAADRPEERPSETLPPQRRVLPPKPPKLPLPPVKPVASGQAPAGSEGRQAVVALATVADRVDSITGRAFALAEKGALFSAKAEFHQALRAIARSLGAQSGSKRYSVALALGLQALEEADDFAKRAQHGPVVNVELIVDAHQTPLLKPYDLSDTTPVAAMQRYYTFAQEQLVMACGGAPVAGRVFYGLGKLHMAMGEESAAAERLHEPKAMAFQQTALLVDPMNYLAANELGVLLARFGKYPEARSVLLHSVSIRPLPETWQNLSVVHRELGEMQLAAQSVANWQHAVQQLQQLQQLPEPQPQTTGSMVQWVAPEQFMGRPGGPPVATRPAPVTDQQTEQSKPKTGFLWW